MVFLIVIVSLCIILVLVAIISSLLSFALKLVTNTKYNEKRLLLPSLLTLLIFGTTFFIIYRLILDAMKMGILDLVTNIVFKTTNIGAILLAVLLPLLFAFIISILLQALALLTINIEYDKWFKNFKFQSKWKHNIQKEVKQITTQETNKDLQVVEKEKKLTFINSLVCCFFIFSLLFFLCIILFFIGSTLGSGLLKKLS